ncbi:class I SAM-dependent methyltransferase [Marinimicrobium sp. C6131]|uniref:DUF938 domain-containing protein n=1 Tax=Marinimicrobium sp. C6131 TaxID=3022676 RepID=UPI00223D32C6|nr:DUF938 domain-containing protein [Marinimicrobium sp. C6131]UZJ45460.1 class I SAM-dependent methyltransferase [Marinimicrobium sp. C6131]
MTVVDKPFSQACENNKQPILSVLAPRFATFRHVLEIGTGTGQHAVYFAAAMPHLTWQTSDLPEHHEGIRTWLADYFGSNLQPPLTLDVTQPVWPLEQTDAVFTSNTFHIMSWEAVLSLLDGCARILSPGGLLVVYGPFNEQGEFTSESNAAFDRQLRSQVAHRGIRNRQTVAEEAELRGLHLSETLELPANNRCLVFTRQ